MLGPEVVGPFFPQRTHLHSDGDSLFTSIPLIVLKLEI